MGSGHQVTVLYEIVPDGRDDRPARRGPVEVPDAREDRPERADEWLTVKMRYKHPEAETSKELSQPLKGERSAKELSDDFRFAAAVASFGMILRDSQFRGGDDLRGRAGRGAGVRGATTPAATARSSSTWSSAPATSPLPRSTRPASGAATDLRGDLAARGARAALPFCFLGVIQPTDIDSLSAPIG